MNFDLPIPNLITGWTEETRVSVGVATKSTQTINTPHTAARPIQSGKLTHTDYYTNTGVYTHAVTLHC